MQHIQRNNGCPCCRATLIEDSEVAEESDDSDYEESDVESIQGEEEEEEEDECSYPIEQFVEAFEKKGYGLKDAVSILLFKFSKTDPKYTKAYIQQLGMDIDDMHEELQNQFEEQVMMSEEDVRIQ